MRNLFLGVLSHELRRSRIAAIALTSLSGDQYREPALTRGFDGHRAKLLKPLNSFSRFSS